MSEHPNVALVRRLLDSMNARDIEAARELATPDFAIHYLQGIPQMRGVWRGYEGPMQRTVLFATMWGTVAD